MVLKWVNMVMEVPVLPERERMAGPGKRVRGFVESRAVLSHGGVLVPVHDQTIKTVRRVQSPGRGRKSDSLGSLR